MSAAEHGSFSLKAVGDWNVTDEDITGSLKGRYGLASLGVGAYVRGNMDIDDFDYTGTDFGADYSFKVTNRVSIGIDYKIPYDSSFNRQDSVILFSLNLSLDAPATSTN